MTQDNIAPHCDYKTNKEDNAIMTIENIRKAMKFAIDNGYECWFLGKIPKEIEQDISMPNVVDLLGAKELEQESCNKNIQYIDIYEGNIKK